MTIEEILDEYDYKLHNLDRDEIKSALYDLMVEVLDNIDNSITQHTVPEGKHLVTRSYVKNTIEFERNKLKGLFDE